MSPRETPPAPPCVHSFRAPAHHALDVCPRRNSCFLRRKREWRRAEAEAPAHPGRDATTPSERAPAPPPRRSRPLLRARTRSPRARAHRLRARTHAHGHAAHGHAAHGRPGHEPRSQPSDSRATGATVIRGTKPAQSASEVTLGRDILDAAPRTSAVDLLSAVPGLVASQHSGEGKAQQLFLRGFDAVHGQDVELNVAGLPVNEVSHIHALGYADLNLLIPETVREVRVTEGSATRMARRLRRRRHGALRASASTSPASPSPAATAASIACGSSAASVRRDQAETFAAVEYVRGDGFGPQRRVRPRLTPRAGRAQARHVTFRAVLGSYATRFDSPGVVRDDLPRGRALLPAPSEKGRAVPAHATSCCSPRKCRARKRAHHLRALRRAHRTCAFATTSPATSGTPRVMGCSRRRAPRLGMRAPHRVT